MQLGLSLPITLPPTTDIPYLTYLCSTLLTATTLYVLLHTHHLAFETHGSSKPWAFAGMDEAFCVLCTLRAPLPFTLLFARGTTFGGRCIRIIPTLKTVFQAFLVAKTTTPTPTQPTTAHNSCSCCSCLSHLLPLPSNRRLTASSILQADLCDPIMSCIKSHDRL